MERTLKVETLYNDRLKDAGRLLRLKGRWLKDALGETRRVRVTVLPNGCVLIEPLEFPEKQA